LCVHTYEIIYTVYVYTYIAYIQYTVYMYTYIAYLRTYEIIYTVYVYYTEHTYLSPMVSVCIHRPN
jgi:hypothetical protein